MSYKKRAKGNWNCGKHRKKDSNREERQYEKQEIRDELSEYEAGESFLYKHVPKRKRNEQARLENHILKYERLIERVKHENMYKLGGWWMGWASSLRDSLKKLKQKWQDKYGSEQKEEE